MLTMGIDTSNYATSLAVYNTETKGVVCDKKRFLPVKEGQLGLRQSDALFHHTVALNEMLQQLAQEVDLTRIDAVGVSTRPRAVEGSYMPCFLAGLTAATAFCTAKNIPLIKTSHQQGHIAAATYATGVEALFRQEKLVFHVSGGTTDLLHCGTDSTIQRIGTSTDLYAGQAVDRVGVKLGFGFPAGVEVSRLASICKESIKPKASVKGMNCSLSGVENQCERLRNEGKSPEYVCKFCLLSIAEAVLRMVKAALEQHPDLPVVFAGGVMSSELIQTYLKNRLENAYFVPGRFSSDNAIGVAVICAKEVSVCVM